MKNSAVLLFALGAVLAAYMFGQNQPTASLPSPIGRFQLFQMKHEILDSQKHTLLTVEEVFRIDTATGRTVVYNEGVNPNGEYHSLWDGPINEPK